MRLQLLLEERYVSEMRRYCGKVEGRLNPSPHQLVSWVDQVYTKLQNNRVWLQKYFKFAFSGQAIVGNQINI